MPHADRNPRAHPGHIERPLFRGVTLQHHHRHHRYTDFRAASYGISPFSRRTRLLNTARLFPVFTSFCIFAPPPSSLSHPPQPSLTHSRSLRPSRSSPASAFIPSFCALRLSLKARTNSAPHERELISRRFVPGRQSAPAVHRPLPLPFIAARSTSPVQTSAES